MKRMVCALALALALVPAFSGAVPTRVGQVPVGSVPVAIDFNPVARAFYVANNGDDSVSVVAAAGAPLAAGIPAPRGAGAFAEVATVRVGDGPAGVAANDRTGLVYVSNQGSGTVSVIAGASVAQTISFGPGSQPWGIAVDAARDRMCVALFGTGKVAVVNTLTHTVVGSIDVAGPVGVAAGGGRCYVTSFYAGTLTAIDPVANTVAFSSLTVPGFIGTCPGAIALTADATRLYTANECDDSISYINPVNGGVLLVARLAPGARPTGVTASGRTVYASQTPLNSVAVLSAVTGAGVSIGGAFAPSGSAISDVPECAAVANRGSADVSFFCDAP